MRDSRKSDGLKTWLALIFYILFWVMLAAMLAQDFIRPGRIFKYGVCVFFISFSAFLFGVMIGLRARR
jgi:hypothetical protein